MKRSALNLLAAAAAFALAMTPFLPVSAAPEPPGPSGLTDSALLSVIATVGDDFFATTDLTALLDPAGASTQHYGPYPSGSSDSGTCGNNWADDTFDRHFTVRTNSDGTYTVIEQFRNGSFMTPSTELPNTNQSPGACQTAPPPAGNGGTVAPGVTGSMHGYFIIPIPAGVTQTSMSPYCDATTPTNPDCTTSTFIDTHFTPPCYFSSTQPICSVTTFFFHYSAGDQGLVAHEWKNASADRGGNSGDIRST